MPDTASTTTEAPHVGRHRDETPLGLLTAAARDNVARYMAEPTYVGKHRKPVTA